MSEDLNRQFFGNPADFLKRFLIVENQLEQFFPSRLSDAAKFINFDLSENQENRAYQCSKKMLFWSGFTRITPVKVTFRDVENKIGSFNSFGRGTQIRCHYVPYKEGLVYSKELTGNAGFFMTHKLSGCTIVISESGSKTCRVSHVAGNLDKSKLTQLIDDHYQGQNPVILHEADYNGVGSIKEDAEFVNLVGVRLKNGEWRFYVQGYDTAGAIPRKFREKTNNQKLSHLAYFMCKEIVRWRP